MIVHTGEKPFACTNCEYRSNLKGNLLLHFKRIHGDNSAEINNLMEFNKTESKQEEGSMEMLSYCVETKLETAPPKVKQEVGENSLIKKEDYNGYDSVLEGESLLNTDEIGLSGRPVTQPASVKQEQTSEDIEEESAEMCHYSEKLETVQLVKSAKKWAKNGFAIDEQGYTYRSGH